MYCWLGFDLRTGATRLSKKGLHVNNRFQVYKRDRTGRVTRVGVVLADNKVQADTKAKMLYGKTLQYSNGETVWTQELAA